jgi:glycosyltransferase involved in cell wall biosynthesis
MIIDSDIINLHWINGGYLSITSLKKLGALNKPIVWTLHDMWAFTGGCHYSLDCKKFQSQCNNCPSLKNAGDQDLSNKIFNQKKFFQDINLTLVTCSKWLKQEAEQSKLFCSKRVENIPNPLDIEFYRPISIKDARHKLRLSENKFYILFGAMNIVDLRKGFDKLLHSLNKLAEELPDYKNQIEVMVFGKANEKLLNSIPYKRHYFGNLKNEDDIVAVYNSADIFVAPSIQDNLPNTVLESLSCGTPVVAYNVGGFPDMINHLKNGYLAEPGSIEDLTEGIKRYLTNEKDYQSQSTYAREKVEKYFNQNEIARKYIQLYGSLIKH